MSEDRVRKFLASATSDDEQIAAEEIQNVAYLRRAQFQAYVNAKFSADEALRLLAAELAAPTFVFPSDEAAPE